MLKPNAKATIVDKIKRIFPPEFGKYLHIENY